MSGEQPTFGEGKIAQPPFQPNPIFSKISTIKLEDMQYRLYAMRKWIRKASKILEQHSLSLPDDDGLVIFRLAKEGKELIGEK